MNKPVLKTYEIHLHISKWKLARLTALIERYKQMHPHDFFVIWHDRRLLYRKHKVVFVSTFSLSSLRYLSAQIKKDLKRL